MKCIHERENGIERIDANRIKELTQKLKEQDDISFEEAEQILLFYYSPGVIQKLPALSAALQDWYKTVSKKLAEGKRGNFIFTIIFSKDKSINKLLLPAQKALKKYGTFEDLCKTIIIDEKLYSTFPYKDLFTEIQYHKDLKKFYRKEAQWAGMYYYPFKLNDNTYTVAGLFKQLAPIKTIPLTNSVDRTLHKEAFKAAIGARDITQDPYIFGEKEVKLFTLAAFIKHKNISCAAAIDVYENHFAVFVEKGRARIVKEALDIPFEKIVENVVHENVIDKETAKTLLNSEYITGFPTTDFINTSVKYLDDVVKTRLKWKDMRKTVEDETEWLEEIR